MPIALQLNLQNLVILSAFYGFRAFKENLVWLVRDAKRLEESWMTTITWLKPRSTLTISCFSFAVGLHPDQHQPPADGPQLFVQLHDLPQLLRTTKEEAATSSSSDPAAQTLRCLWVHLLRWTCDDRNVGDDDVTRETCDDGVTRETCDDDVTRETCDDDVTRETCDVTRVTPWYQLRLRGFVPFEKTSYQSAFPVVRAVRLSLFLAGPHVKFTIKNLGVYVAVLLHHIGWLICNASEPKSVQDGPSSSVLTSGPLTVL